MPGSKCRKYFGKFANVRAMRNMLPAWTFACQYLHLARLT